MFQPPSNAGYASSSPYLLGVADLDNDGFLDVAAGSYGSSAGHVSLWINTRSNSFKLRTDWPTTGADLYDGALADFDRDGWPDAAAVFFTGSAAVLLNNRMGGLGAATVLPMGGVSNDLIAPDLNSDGKPDLVVCDYPGNRILVRLNTSN